MPPDDPKEKRGVWGKYRNLIIIGVAVVVVVLIGVGIKANSSSDSITLTSLSNQLQTIQSTLISQAAAIDDIPTTDSVADLSEIQDSIAGILTALDSIEEELAGLTENISSVDMTALNMTIWENHLMLEALCESLNITGIT